MSQEQIVNAPYLDINGGILSYDGSTAIIASACKWRDATNTYDFSTSAPIVIRTTFAGVNGLDTGTVANNSWYAVYAIGDPLRYKSTAFLLSLNATTPLLPYGYGAFRRIGWIRTDNSGLIFVFIQKGVNSTTRLYQYESTSTALTGGAATTYTAVNLNAVPPQQCPVNLIIKYTPNSAANILSIRGTGLGGTAGSSPILIQSPTTAQITVGQSIICGLNSGIASIDYAGSASDATTILVTGYEDNI